MEAVPRAVPVCYSVGQSMEPVQMCEPVRMCESVRMCEPVQMCESVRMCEPVRMCESVQMLRCFVSQRLSAAVAEISEMFEKTIRAHETHTADVQQLVVTKEEDDPVSPDQDDPPEPSHIKEEQEDFWTSRAQLQGLDQADIKFTFFPVAVKSEEDDEEDDEEKPQSSQLHQRQTEDMKPEADGEDCGGPEPDRDSDPDHHDKTSHSSELETKAGDDWKKSSGPQSGNRGCDPGEKPFSCSECGKRFSRNKIMKTHMRIHTGEKPFSCSVCQKTFQRRETAVIHMRVHTGEKPFSCSVCGARFSSRSNLSRHERMHTAEKPFSCSVCGKRFARKTYLSTHLTVHTGEKPFSCSVCGKTFSQKGNLKQHLFVHSEETALKANSHRRRTCCVTAAPRSP